MVYWCSAMSAQGRQLNPFHLIGSLDEKYTNKKSTLKAVIKEALGISVIQIEVAGISFAVEVGVAVETILYRKPQKLPRSYDWALGVIEVRGEVIPIIDLSMLSNRKASIIDKNSRLVIIRYEQLVFGLLVSHVSAVSYVSEIREGQHDELVEFGWRKETTDKWVDIQGKKTYFFDLRELLNQTDFLTLTY